MFKTLFVIALSLLTFITANLGMDYINFGHGLHPAIAFPVSTVAVILAVTVHKWAYIGRAPYKAK